MKETTLSTKIMIGIFFILLIGVVSIGILSGLDNSSSGNSYNNEMGQEQPF